MIEEKKQNVKEKDNEKMRKHKYGIHYFDKKGWKSCYKPLVTTLI